jgi:hypothetical protein
MTDADTPDPGDAPPPEPTADGPSAPPDPAAATTESAPSPPPAAAEPAAPPPPAAAEPPPPTAPAAEAPAARSASFAPRPLAFGPGQILVVLGLVAVVASIFLHWLDFTVSVLGVHRSTSANASDVPVAFLFDYKTNATDPSLLVVLVPIVVLVFTDLLLFRHRIVTLVAAVVTLGTVGLFCYQLNRTTDRISAASRNIINPSLTDLLGIGVYVAFAGGILLFIGALLTRPGLSRGRAATAEGPEADERAYPPRLPTAPPRESPEP